MILRLLKFTTFSILFLASFAWSVETVGSKDRLHFLKKIQGRWQSDCRKVFSAEKVLFEQTTLSVSFTQLTFATVEYTNKECFLEYRKYQTLYAYTIGDAIPEQKGSAV